MNPESLKGYQIFDKFPDRFFQFFIQKIKKIWKIWKFGKKIYDLLLFLLAQM